jgi:hypothetical protein
VKDEFVKLRVTGEERDAWKRSANVAGLSLAAYVRRCVQQSQSLADALEAQAEDERRRQKARGRSPSLNRSVQGRTQDPGLGRLFRRAAASPFPRSFPKASIRRTVQKVRREKPAVSSGFLDGAYRDRTGDLRLAKPALSQLS